MKNAYKLVDSMPVQASKENLKSALADLKNKITQARHAAESVSKERGTLASTPETVTRFPIADKAASDQQFDEGLRQIF